MPRPVQTHRGGSSGHKDWSAGSEAQVGAGWNGEARGLGVKTREWGGGTGGGGGGTRHAVRDTQAHSQFIVARITRSCACVYKHVLDHRFFL